MFRVPLFFLVLLSGCQASRSITTRPSSGRGEIQRPSDRAESGAPQEPIVRTSYELPEPLATTSSDSHETPSANPLPEQSAAEPSYPLTLENLELVALGYNPTIPQAGTLVRQQEGTTIQASLYPNPQAGYVRSDPDQAGQSRTSGVFLSQTFVTAGKLRLAQQASRYDVTLRAWQLNAQKQRVVNDVRIRFHEALGAQESVATARELEGSAAEGVRIARGLIEARHGGRPDLLQAEMQLSLARQALKDAEYRSQAGRRQLASILGVSKLPAGDFIGSLDDSTPELSWESSLQRLLDASPLLKSQAAELQAARTEVQLARAQAVPDLNVQVVAQRDSAMHFNSVSTLLSLPLPLFNRNQGGIIEAEAFLVQQQKEFERLQRALSDQLAASFQQYSTLRSEIGRIRSELLPMATENLELTSEAYRQGRMDFLRVVDARRTYFQTRMTQIQTLTELHKVIAEIEGLQLTGGLNPTEIGTALQTLSGRPGASARSVLLQQLQNQQNKPQRNLPGVIQAAEQ